MLFTSEYLVMTSRLLVGNDYCGVVGWGIVDEGTWNVDVPPDMTHLIVIEQDEVGRAF